MTDSPESGVVYPGPLEGAVEEIRTIQKQIAENQKTHDEIVTQKEAAIEVAIKPFQGRIDHYDRELKRLGETNLTMIVEQALREYRANLDTVDDAALAVFINENGDGIQEFCYDIKKAVVENLDYETRAQRTLGMFSIFQSFSEAVRQTNEPLPVGILSIDWLEEVQETPDLEEKNKATGVFSKIVTGYFGYVGPESLEVLSEVKSDGAVEYDVPQVVQLRLFAPARLVPTTVWGKVSGASIDPLNNDVPVPIVGKVADYYPAIDWERSQLRDFSGLRSTFREDVYRSTEPTQVLLFGDGLRAGLDELIADEKVDQTLKPALQAERDLLG